MRFLRMILLCRHELSWNSFKASWNTQPISGAFSHLIPDKGSDNGSDHHQSAKGSLARELNQYLV